jgi:fructoselysine-6-P-deglycase FrlB-like protein
MVAAQPELVAPILDDPAISDVARLVREATGRDEPVVVAGCGTSEHGARAIAHLIGAGARLGGHPGAFIISRQALDAAHDPYPGGLFIAVTHDGGTRATQLAAEAAREAGARIALVTGNGEGPLAHFADTVVVTPLRDRSWCHTVAYSSAILAGGAVVASMAGVALDAASLRAYLAAAVTDDGQASTVAAALWPHTPLIAAGAGADDITARELALKVEEGPRKPSVARHLETLLHGHLVACGSDTGLVLLAVDPAGSHRDTRLALASRAAAAVGTVPTGILAAEAEIPDWATPGGRIVLPPAPASALSSLPALLGGAAALQRLTLALVERAGVNPDLIRREEEPYRAAAAVAEESGDW